jgi:hypothetical protein
LDVDNSKIPQQLLSSDKLAAEVVEIATAATAAVALPSEDSSITDASSEHTSTPQFIWTKQWYPIAVENFTSKDKPHKLQLLGNDIVLW